MLDAIVYMIPEVLRCNYGLEGIKRNISRVARDHACPSQRVECLDI
jgi:hypothetical protein